MNIPELNLPRVVIIGCGFAGLRMARSLNSKQVQIVMFDQNNYHTFQPLLYQVATSGLEPDSVAYPIRKVFKNKPNFHFRWAKVEKIDTENQRVVTSIGDVLYDHLIIASGADSNFFGLDMVETYAIPMKSLTESLDLRSLILQNFEQSLNTNSIKKQERLMNFVIVGAGPTGVELAGALGELKKHVLPRDYPDLDIRRMQIHLVEAADKVLPSMSKHAAVKSEHFLTELGVNIWLNTQVKDFDGRTIVTNRKNFESETLIWAAGVKGAPVEGLKAEMAKGNRIVVDEYNRVKGYENIYAVGDVAAMITDKVPKGHPMLASVAVQQGKWLGYNFNRQLKGKKMLPFSYFDKGTMATVGRNKAVVDLPFASFSGLFAWITWMFVHLMLLVEFRNRLVVFVNWAWSYVNFDKGTRLIVRKFRRKKSGATKAPEGVIN